MTTNKVNGDGPIVHCVIPAKLVLDLIGERESTHAPHYWIPAFAGMTRLRRYDKASQV